MLEYKLLLYVEGHKSLTINKERMQVAVKTMVFGMKPRTCTIMRFYINATAKPAAAATTPIFKFSVIDIAADVGEVEAADPEEDAVLLPGAG